MGSVGSVNVQAGGEVAPGYTTGILHTGDFNLLSPTSRLSIELDKPTVGSPVAGADYDQLNVTGSTLLAGDLAFTITTGVGIEEGDLFFIVINDGSDAVSGTFATVNGSTFDAMAFAGAGSGHMFEISYTADFDTGSFSDGNDVAIRAVSTVPEPNSLAMLTGSLGLALSLQRFRRRRS
jgi:hypothetical protein